MESPPLTVSSPIPVAANSLPSETSSVPVSSNALLNGNGQASSSSPPNPSSFSGVSAVSSNSLPIKPSGHSHHMSLNGIVGSMSPPPQLENLSISGPSSAFYPTQTAVAISSPSEVNSSSTSGVPLDALDDLEISNRGHIHELERIIEYGGPNAQFSKLNTILGRGAYKTVWKGLDREEGIEIAWNVLETTKNEYHELVQETEILKKVRHPNIIHFYDSWYSNGEFVFITELMTSGTLREYIKKFKNPSMKIIKRWARQILKGLHYLHSQSPPIIHRDIKCDNIFINGSHGEVKIGDMGTAKMKFGKKYTVIGTPEFMAPEMYEEKGYSEKVDIYAFGMCLLEMVTGEYPYGECKNAAQIYKKVSQGLRPDCLNKVEDKDVLGIILNCLAPENERWSARKLVEHPFFAEDPDVSLLSVDDSRAKLTIQVVFKGSDKQTVKFDFNIERDTVDNVVNEMIEEQILSSKFRQFVTSAIHKILRDLSRTPTTATTTTASSSAEDASSSNKPPVPPRMSSSQILMAANATPAQLQGQVSGHSQHQSLSQPHQLQHAQQAAPIPLIYQDKIVHQPPGLSSSTKKTFGPDGMNFDFEPMTRDYPNDFPIEDFVLDVAISCNRDSEKAKEWLFKLKNQDIMTVGDLRDLHEDDWAHLNLTVFASRALKNGLSRRTMTLNPNSNSGSSNSTASGNPVLLSPRLSAPSVITNGLSPTSSNSKSNGGSSSHSAPHIQSPVTPLSGDE